MTLTLSVPPPRWEVAALAVVLAAALWLSVHPAAAELVVEAFGVVLFGFLAVLCF